jgi:hypothetical protein
MFSYNINSILFQHYFIEYKNIVILIPIFLLYYFKDNEDIKIYDKFLKNINSLDGSEINDN